jgi:hypothetical protein
LLKPGRIRLPSGLTINCAYEFGSDEEGRIELFPAFLNELQAGDTATLIPSEGVERSIVLRRLEREHASFELVDRTLPDP